MVPVWVDIPTLDIRRQSARQVGGDSSDVTEQEGRSGKGEARDSNRKEKKRRNKKTKKKKLQQMLEMKKEKE